MNKKQITQEEFDKKVEEIVNYKIKNDYLLQGISPGGVRQKFTYEANNLKERYDIK